MQPQLYAFVLAFLVYQAFASPIYEIAAAACPAEKCFASVKLLPPLAKIASAFCSPYIKFTPTVTTTSPAVRTSVVTNIVTTSVSLAGPTATQLVTVSPPPVTVSSTCATSLVPFSTSVEYPTLGANVTKRATIAATTIPTSLAAGWGTGNALTSKISSACSCYLGNTKTVTASTTSVLTSTAIVSSTVSLPGQTQTVMSTVTADPVTVTACQTATSIDKATCGVPVSTYTTGAKITCSGTGATPQETVARFRIEGGSTGTIHESCIAAGPKDITTPSGGTHKCDGTNNNANPLPGGTLITAFDAAGKLNGFGFDGTFSTQFDDFFINTIAGTSQTSNQFWGVLRDLVFTPAGGCEGHNSPGEGLWAFDAFNKNYFLKLSSDFAAVKPGDIVSVTVLGVDGNGGPANPISGASFAGQTSDGNGNVAFTAPSTPGCYQYKAERSSAIRSLAFYLTVM